MHRVVTASVAFVVLLTGCATGHVRRVGSRSVTSTTGRPARTATESSTAAPSTTTTRVALGDGAVAGATVVRTVVVSGVTRSYRLYVPPALATSRRVPLVIVLHGASGNAARAEFRYHWDPLAAQRHFVVVYPQGIDGHWNPSLVPGASDDIGFVSSLVDRLLRSLPVDPARVYVAGMSNGAAMTYRLGCALSARLAAIAVVEGWNPGCAPAVPVSLVVVHGLADEEVVFSRAEASASSWRTFDRCDATNDVTRHGLVSITVWPACSTGSQVAFYAVAGSGHEWPGSSPPLPGHDVPSTALDATAAIWAFFAQHTR